MTTISAQTLMVAIRAVDQHASDLQERMETAPEEEIALMEEELLAVSKAESELEQAYTEVQKASDNLPLYSRLLAEE